MSNKRSLFYVIIWDALLLYFTLFLYEYAWVYRIIPYFVMGACIVFNVRFLVFCLLNKQFRRLILVAVPIILIALMNDRFDRNILIIDILKIM
jgi:hypothetical protein